MSAPRRRFRPATHASRLLFAAGFSGALALVAGFGWFADTVTRMAPPPDAPRVDGVVSLTGGSDARLKTGVTLIQRGIAPRLLISGVNPAARTEEVRLVAGGARDLYACCIDLGRTAADTIGNAREIAEWTSRHRMRTIILVTDTYHMPRSLFEVRRAVPGVEVIAWPVRENPYVDGRWWQDERITRFLALEYGKYLVTRATSLLGLDAREPRVSERDEAKRA